MIPYSLVGKRNSVCEKKNVTWTWKQIQQYNFLSSQICWWLLYKQKSIFSQYNIEIERTNDFGRMTGRLRKVIKQTHKTRYTHKKQVKQFQYCVMRQLEKWQRLMMFGRFFCLNILLYLVLMIFSLLCCYFIKKKCIVI